MSDQIEPVRKSSLPCTPPPEYEFHTVMGARPDGLDGCMLMPGDMGPKVIRRRVSYGDWEPVSPDCWADEPVSSPGWAEATEADTCRPVEVDGGTVRVRGSGELSEEGHEALTALVRAAKAKFAEEAPEQKARRAKEHQLDGIRRALCDAGFMEDDDPYSHADLADVIRQAGELVGPLLAEVAAARQFAAEMRDFCSPHGVAADYADQLEAAMDRAKEER